MNDTINWAMIPPHDFSKTNKNELLLFNIGKVASNDLKAKLLQLKLYNDSIDSIKKENKLKANQLKHVCLIKVANKVKQLAEITEQKDSFWLTALMNCGRFHLNTNDLTVLSYLSSIYIEFNDKESFSMRVNYAFYENECLSSRLLWKEYYYSKYTEANGHDDEDGLIRVNASGVKWKDEMKNPSIKMISLSSKGTAVDDMKKSTSIRAEWEKVSSFFDMFSINEKKEIDLLNEADECEFIKEDFIPNILYYYMNMIPDH